MSITSGKLFDDYESDGQMFLAKLSNILAVKLRNLVVENRFDHY